MIFGFLACVAAMCAGYYAMSRFDIFIKGLWHSFAGQMVGAFAFVIFGMFMNNIFHIEIWGYAWCAKAIFICMIIGVIGGTVLYDVELRKKGYRAFDIFFSSSTGIAILLFLVALLSYFSINGEI